MNAGILLGYRRKKILQLESELRRAKDVTRSSIEKAKSDHRAHVEKLEKKIEDLHKLAKALLTYETLSGEEIENLINKNIYPADKEHIKVEGDKSSALSSMGLKPKIVH